MEWQQIIAASDYFNRSILFKEQLEEPVADYNYVLTIIQKIVATPDEFGHVRLFVENKGKKYDGNSFFYKYPPLKGETLQRWSKRVFRKKKFGIIINRVEKWDDAFLNLVQNKIHEIQKVFPTPVFNYELTLFIGNYRFTPFGIHVDSRYERTIHFNLGPANREMVLWQKDDFVNITGSENPYFEPYRIYHHNSRKYIITTKDVFILKGDEYHIGGNRGLAIGLAIAIQKNNRFSLLDFIINNLYKNLFSGIDDTSFGNARTSLSYFRRVRNSILANPVHAGNGKMLAATVDEYDDLMVSNNGFISPPVVNKEIFPVHGDFIKVANFPILVKKSGERLLLAVRGRKISLKYNKTLKAVINHINNSISSFSSQSLSLEFNLPGPLIEATLKVLYEHRIIRLYDP